MRNNTAGSAYSPGMLLQNKLHAQEAGRGSRHLTVAVRRTGNAQVLLIADCPVQVCMHKRKHCSHSITHPNRQPSQAAQLFRGETSWHGHHALTEHSALCWGAGTHEQANMLHFTKH